MDTTKPNSIIGKLKSWLSDPEDFGYKTDHKFGRFLNIYRYPILFGAILLVYFFNLLIDVMELDAAQYAMISLEMSWTKSFLQVFEQGKDYLDKPPLLFWLSSLSYLVFGVSNFSYKLPSLLLAILGIYSVYRFSLIYYSREISLLAALILASSQALFLITNDVRTDTNLLGLVMFAVWQISEYLRNPKWKYLILGSIGIGGAMLAKGPVALVIMMAAFGTDFLLKREWKNIFKPQWILVILIVAILLAPMCYGLYMQFDLHPEKTVYGLKGPSGLGFFFWTQSFGRISGDNYLDNHAGYFFFLQTIIWDFQPWIFFFIPALIGRIGKLFQQKFKIQSSEESVTIGGFVLVFIALSLSRYKLPHYIFVLFPFAAIITAKFIYDMKESLLRKVSKVQIGVIQIFWLAIILDFAFFFPPASLLLPAIFLILYFLNWIIFRKLNGKTEQLFIPTILTAISFNLMMAISFYPELLKYQSTSQAGKFVKESHIAPDHFYQYKESSLSLDFYSGRITPGLTENEVIGLKKGTWIFTNEQGLEEIRNSGETFKVLKVFPSFKVTELSLPFLIPKTRESTLKNDYILEIE